MPPGVGRRGPAAKIDEAFLRVDLGQPARRIAFRHQPCEVLGEGLAVADHLAGLERDGPAVDGPGERLSFPVDDVPAGRQPRRWLGRKRTTSSRTWRRTWKAAFQELEAAAAGGRGEVR